jgi:hypothetical protein
MKRKSPRWLTELWEYLSRGDGIKCPIYQSCQLRLNGAWCVSDHEEYFESRNEFLDDDESDLSKIAGIDFELPLCATAERILNLVRKLANKYRFEAGISRLPISDNIVTRAYDNLPIEVRLLPLKAYHGAVWRLSDCWLVQLNSNDTFARQRLTLYHEIFHVLAHCKATPAFKKSARRWDVSLTEILADHFAIIFLLPRAWIAKIWPEVGEISRMAAIFDVPKPVMYFVLRGMRLI